MGNTLNIAEKVYEILEKNKKIKCSFLKKSDSFCHIKVENYNNSKRNSILIDEEIFFSVDEEEYYSLNDYKKAIEIFLTKLEKVATVYITGVDDSGNTRDYGFNCKITSNQDIISQAEKKLKSSFSFLNNIKEMKVSDFYGDFEFSAKWDGEKFITNNTNFKR